MLIYLSLNWSKYPLKLLSISIHILLQYRIKFFHSKLEKNCHCLQIMVIYTENPKDATSKLLKLINEFGNIAEYKISTQKSLAYLYRWERENQQTIPFVIASKRIKYLGVNLPKEAKALGSENYKTLMKEIEDGTNRWKGTPCSWIWRMNAKWIYYQSSSLQIQCNPYQITSGIFHRTRRKKKVIYMETLKTLSSQSNLEKEEWSWKNQSPWLQIILQSRGPQNSVVLAQKQTYRSVE